MRDEILHGYQVLLFSCVSEQISRRVTNEVGDARESLSANWQNIILVGDHRFHPAFPARSALLCHLDAADVLAVLLEVD